MSNGVRRVDQVQQRHRALGIPIAVVYKYGDDQGNYLAATITYYAFVAIFPLLLLATSILGFLLQAQPSWRQAVLNSTLTEFPIVGDQLGTPEGLTGSVVAVLVGGLAAMYGAMGLGQSIQNAMHVVWSVPRNNRPNPFLLRLKSLVLLLAAGVALLLVTTVSILGRNLHLPGDAPSAVLRWTISVADVVLIAWILTVLLRLAAAQRLKWRQAAPGAVLIALLWQVLQLLSTTYLDHLKTQVSSMNKTFGLVLGLVGLIYLAAVIGVLGMELNAVLARRLYPRALLTPFTDAVTLTEADRRAYTGYAEMQRHKGFERVEVSFDHDPDDPDA